MSRDDLDAIADSNEWRADRERAEQVRAAHDGFADSHGSGCRCPECSFDAWGGE